MRTNMTSRHEELSVTDILLVSGNVRRYHTTPHVIGQQTVAEHTYRAMVLMVTLWPNYTLNALRALLFHDGAEGAVGDVPAPVKWTHPELKTALDWAEGAVLRHHNLDVALSDEEYHWLKLVDLLEAAIFAIDQMVMGNVAMREVHEACLDALRKLGNIPESVKSYHFACYQQLDERRLLISNLYL